MIGWKNLTLDDIGKWGSGGTPLSSVPEYYGGCIPWLIIEDLNDGVIEKYSRTITEAGLKNSAAKLLPKGTLLIAMYGSIGKLGITSFECATNQAIAFCQLNPNIARTDFVFYYLLFRRNDFINLGTGVTQQNISQEKIRPFQIPLPPLDEQQRIAAILQKADRVRRLRRYARSMSESVLQGVFLEMFGDPAKNNKGWDLYEIGEITNVETGGTPSRADNVNFNGNIPWVKTGEVVGNVITDTEEKITEEGLRSSNCEIFPVNSIIVAMYGQGLTRGRTAKLGIPAATNQACAAILPSNKINTDYLWACLKISYERLRDLGRGGNQPNLNLSMIREFLVPIPPLEHQDQFCIIMQKLSRVETQSVESERQAEHLFQSLLKRAFAGQL